MRCKTPLRISASSASFVGGGGGVGVRDGRGAGGDVRGGGFTALRRRRERGAGARAGVCGVCTTLTKENAALTFYFQSEGGRGCGGGTDG